MHIFHLIVQIIHRTNFSLHFSLTLNLLLLIPFLDEGASTSGASDSERAEYFRLSQEIREAEAPEQFSAVSSHSLSVLVGNSTFFNQAKQLLEDLEKKKLRLPTLRSKLLLDGVDEILLENAGLRSLAESVAQTIRDKFTCSMSLIRRCQEMINKEAGWCITWW